jgi:hypothetical protein
MEGSCRLTEHLDRGIRRGIGAFSSNHTHVVELLTATCFLPILFFNIDVANNRWYCRLVRRERSVSDFLNSPGSSEFPVYDGGGYLTFKSDWSAKWAFCRLRSFVDPIPLAFYSVQALFSTIALIPDLKIWKLAPVAATIVLIAALWVTAFFVRRKYLRMPEESSGQAKGGTGHSSAGRRSAHGHSQAGLGGR